MKILVAISFAFLFAFAGAQQTIVISGNVKDTSVNKPVMNAKVYIENNDKNAVYTNRLGNFTLKADITGIKNPVLVVNDVQYDIYKYPLKKSEIKKSGTDTVKLNVILKFRELPELTITARPDTAFSSEQLSVSDFEFYGKNFVLLVYEKKLEKDSKVIYVDENQSILSTFTVPDVAKELYKDFAGKIYVVCEKRTFQVEVRDDVLSLYPLENDFFEKQVRPWVDTTENKAYFSDFVWYYPEFNYYVYNVEDSSYKNIHKVVDKPLMELFRAQYKYVDGRDKLTAYRAQLETGVDKEIWIAIWSGFPNSIYYDQLYAPMFIKEDTIMIFDHYTNKLYRYDARNNPIDSVDISYHIGVDKKEWEQLLVKDQETGVIYSVYLRGGKYYLKELNTSTGEVKNVFRLYYKYPEKLQVRDGYAYYIYRPYESAQKKFLYKEKFR
ncbi:MAG: hypothetical protein ACOZCO_09210 [Bacteroidota bacterium]